MNNRKPDPTARGKAGFHPFRSASGRNYGSFEVTWFDAGEAEWPGWYWAACWPGCMPDGDWCGPFPTSHAAWRDARQV